jgi:NapC/NirT cytochrome c family, N-terminal region
MTSAEDRQPDYFNNWISIAGKIFSIICFVIITCLFLLDFFLPQKNPYLGILAYMLVPGFLILSLLLIPGGALIERARSRKSGYIPKFPVIDFNNPLHQKWAYTTWAVVTVFLLFSAIGIYKAYDFTESNTFCGRVCHTVMEPEYTAYHESSHARVKCAQCHIGEGAVWFVRSKLSGVYQVYSVLAKAYPRPIATPVHSLRPAPETCEQCHWPQKFFGSVEQNHAYFLPDKLNTEWRTRMLIFVGGGSGASSQGTKEGIHSHMIGDHKVQYIATDKKRQVIPWIRMVGADGKEEIFVDKESGYTAENPPKGEKRVMDCMDCHNRPSHAFEAPSKAVNKAMARGAIDPSLPYIKKQSVEALVGKYTSHKDAETRIRKAIERFYQENHPEILVSKQEAVEKSIQGIVRIYKTNFFPTMNVSWKVYPDNIGHVISPGCFRCHSGRHQTKEGKTVSNDCKACHAIIAQGPPGKMESGAAGLEFKHPDQDVGDAWKEMQCNECHTGE